MAVKNSSVIHFPVPRSETAIVPVAPLPAQDEALFEDMIKAYVDRRRGSLKHHPKSVSSAISVIRDFAVFSAAPPWRWTPGDFDLWCSNIGLARKLSVASQRKYQGAIAGFLAYLISNQHFQNTVHFRYGLTLTQIVGSENRIPHIQDREMKCERRAFTHEEIAKFFDALDAAIVEAMEFRSKDLRPLQRDKVAFYVMYVLGARIGEVRALNVGSFEMNPRFPEFGDFGFVRVWGKGSRGSGPKMRTVMVDHKDLPPLLEWYMSEIRPIFLENGHPNEDALFLSERGQRLAISTLENRFQHAVSLANLEGLNLTPHCMRHSSLTHTRLNVSLESVRLKAGHVYTATTQVYLHLGDEHVQQEMGRAIEAQISRVRDDKS
jgi:site-specific recombinase XerD